MAAVVGKTKGAARGYYITGGMLVHREWAFEWPPKKPPVYPDAMPTPDAPADAALIENLSRQLADDIRAYRRWLWRRRLGRIVRIGLIAGLIMTVFHRNWHGFWWLFLIFGGSKVTDARADRRKRTAGLLARTRDPRAVNVLAVAHRSGDPATRAVAAKALAEVLPMLKASDAERITPEGMRALIAILNIRGTGVAGLIDMGLILAVLDALKQVGDARAIPAVERLIAMPYFINVIVRISERWHYRAIGDSVRRVRSSAEECLEVLRVRAKLERDRNTLLRPAERSDGEERVLLRPAMGVPLGQDLTLVRPAYPDGPASEEEVPEPSVLGWVERPAAESPLPQEEEGETVRAAGTSA